MHDKKTAPQSDELLRGDSSDTLTVSQKRFSGYIPTHIVRALHRQASGLNHGKVVLELYVRDGALTRYEIGGHASVLLGACDE